MPRELKSSPARPARAASGAALKHSSAKDSAKLLQQQPPAWENACVYGLYPLLLLCALAFLTIRAISDPDLWFHMAFGRYLVGHHGFPHGDVFSFTAAGREWISSGWASSVLLYGLFEFFGRYEWFGPAAGPVLMVLGVVASAHLLIYFTAVLRYKNRGSVALLLLASMLASFLRYNPRPDVWSLLLVTGLCLVLVAADEHAKASGQKKFAWRLLLLPALVALWANLHAGFVAGLLVIGLFLLWQLYGWLKERKQGLGAALPSGRLFAVAMCALALLAWIFNPYGARIWALAGKIKDIPGVNLLVYEWMPLVYYPAYSIGWPTYLGVTVLLALAGWILWREKGNVAPWRYAVMGLFVAFMFFQRRQVGLAALVLPALLVPNLAQLDGLFGRLRGAGRALLPAAVTSATLCLCALQYTGTLKIGDGWPIFGLECRMLPCLASDFLRENRPPQNMFNSYGMGGYLLYHLAPETKVFIDGRLDVYDHKTWADFLAAEDGTLSLDDVVNRYKLNSFVIDIKDSYDLPEHLATRLTARPDWRLVYFDDDVAVFVRQSEQTAAYTAKLGFNYVSPFAPQRLEEALKNPQLVPQVLVEIKRALQQTQGSANANALAAMAASRLGETEVAQQNLGAALARDPNCYLAHKLLQGATK